MRRLFERTVRTAVSTKLVDLAVQAVDGTKVIANASMKRIRGVGDAMIEPVCGGLDIQAWQRSGLHF